MQSQQRPTEADHQPDNEMDETKTTITVQAAIPHKPLVGSQSTAPNFRVPRAFAGGRIIRPPTPLIPSGVDLEDTARDENGEVRLPVVWSKQQRRLAMCMQITEAASFQRTYFDEKGQPNPRLRAVKGNSAQNQLASVVKLSLPTVVRRNPSSTTPTPRQPNSRPGTASQDSYMMLSNRALKALLKDVNVLLAPHVEKDYTTDVLNQVWGLRLFQPSSFPIQGGEGAAIAGAA